MTDFNWPSSDWLPLGRTASSHYYRAAPGILVVIPDHGTRDTEATARESVGFQSAFARSEPPPCAVVVQMTGIFAQEAGARRVYSRETDPALFCSVGFVAPTPLARAIASFFLGLTRPPFPTRVFEEFEPAIAWSAGMRNGAGA